MQSGPSLSSWSAPCEVIASARSESRLEPAAARSVCHDLDGPGWPSRASAFVSVRRLRTNAVTAGDAGALHRHRGDCEGSGLVPAYGEKRVSDYPTRTIAFVCSPPFRRTIGLPRRRSPLAGMRDDSAGDLASALPTQRRESEGGRLVPACGDVRVTHQHSPNASCHAMGIARLLHHVRGSRIGNDAASRMGPESRHPRKRGAIFEAADRRVIKVMGLLTPQR